MDPRLSCYSPDDSWVVARVAVSQVVEVVPQYSAVEAYVCVGWGFVPVVESCPQEAKAMYVVQCFSVGGALALGAGGFGIDFAPP